MMMHRHRHSAFLPTLFIICLLLLSSSPNQGHGRELGVIGTKTDKYHDVAKEEEMIDVMDYGEPGANTNPKNGFHVTPPPPPPFY